MARSAAAPEILDSVLSEMGTSEKSAKDPPFRSPSPPVHEPGEALELSITSNAEEPSFTGKLTRTEGPQTL